MGFNLTPPPIGQAIDTFVWRDWFNRLRDALANLVLGTDQGGTGLTEIGSAGEVLGVNSAGDGLEYKEIKGIGGIEVVNSDGEIALKNSYGGMHMMMDAPVEETYVYITQVAGGGSGSGDGLTHPEVLSRVSFRM